MSINSRLSSAMVVVEWFVHHERSKLNHMVFYVYSHYFVYLQQTARWLNYTFAMRGCAKSHAELFTCSDAAVAWPLHVVQSDHTIHLFYHAPEVGRFLNHFVSVFRWLCVWSWRAACEGRKAEPRPYDFIWDDCWLHGTPVQTSFHCLLVSKRKRGGSKDGSGKDNVQN